MGDRLVTIDISRKVRAAVLLSVGELGPHLTQCGLSRGLPPCQVSLIHPTVWLPQYTSVTDRTLEALAMMRYINPRFTLQDKTDRTDRQRSDRKDRANRFINGHPKMSRK